MKGLRNMKTNHIERINEMESILDECVEAVEELQASLEYVERLQEKMEKLFEYYGSKEWYEDREAYDAVDAEDQADIKAGVLSEDSVYDLITDVRDESFHMIELGTDILKNRI